MTTHDVEALRKARLEDAAWLVETGENLTGAAARLGMKPAALNKFLVRHAPHLQRQLLARDPRDHNTCQDPRSIA